MEDIAKQNKMEESALVLAREIADHNGEDTVLIDLSGRNSWTDYFLITTVSSSGHLKGLVRNVREKLSQLDIEMLHSHKRISEDGWELIDCGFLVIHLMTKEMREFYDLERLWFEGKVIYREHTEEKEVSESGNPSLE
jgi:ribosome-associated protein